MMRLPKFEYVAPKTAHQAVALLEKHGADAKLLAGGTDLLVSMKQRLFAPKVVVGLGGVRELRKIKFDKTGGLTLGAGVTWDEVIADKRARKHYPALVEAAEFVATPTLQNKGTVGGNICLDTRCWYYNQSHFWRKSLGWCMKKGSDYCHVAPGLGKCVAVFSSDPVPAMMAYGASVTLLSPAGERTIPLADLYQDDGIHFLRLRPNEIVVSARLPPPAPGTRATHKKMRKRESIDYPIANCSARVTFSGDGTVADCAIVLGAVASAPVVAVDAQKIVIGRKLTGETVRQAAEAAYHAVKPLPNTSGTPVYRKKIARVLVKRALTELAGA